jgi:DNA polymerase-3 subunit delta
MSFDAALRDIHKGVFAPVYYLYGDDEFPIQEIIKALKEKVAAGPMAQFNLDELSGTSLSWAAVLERVRTLPMMASHRLVIAWDVDKLFKKSEDDLSAIEAYVTEPLPETVLVFTAKGLDKRTKFAKVLDKSKSRVLEAGHPKPSEVPGLVRRFAEAWGKRIDSAAAQALADLVGTETMWIRNEVEKLCLYVGERDQITEDDVKTVMADVNIREVWDLTDALARKDFAECIRLLDPILREGEPPMILGALANEMRKIAKVKHLQIARRSREEIAREAGIRPFFLDKVLGHARSFSLGELNQIYRRLEATDIRLKRTAQPARIVLESLIADICLA